jgi:hypothetical protein
LQEGKNRDTHKASFQRSISKQLSTKPSTITQPAHCKLATLQFAKQIPHRNPSEIVLHPTSLKVKIAAESLPNGWPEICGRSAGHTGRGIIHFEGVHDCCGSRLWDQNFATMEDLQAVATHGIRPQRSEVLIARKQEGAVSLLHTGDLQKQVGINSSHIKRPANRKLFFHTDRESNPQSNFLRKKHMFIQGGSSGSGRY